MFVCVLLLLAVVFLLPLPFKGVQKELMFSVNIYVGLFRHIYVT